MARKVLIVNGSPRKKGNTATLIERLIEGVEESNPDAEIKVVDLHSLSIKPCKACDGCRREGREGDYCVIDDDMASLYKKTVKADAIVFACPIYWFSVSAQMKLFMDRLYGLWLERTKAFEGKRLAVMLVYGDADEVTSGAVNAIHMFEDTAKYCKAQLVGVVHGTAGDIGDAKKDQELCKKAKELGKALL